MKRCNTGKTSCSSIVVVMYGGDRCYFIQGEGGDAGVVLQGGGTRW